MKTKNVMKSVMIFAISALLVTGCKKKEDTVPDENPATTEATVKQSNADDQTKVDQQQNESIDDVNQVLNDNSNTRTELPCDVTIDSAALMTQGLIKLTYHGFSCDHLRTRSGVISVQLPYDAVAKKPIRWNAKGAKIIITYTNYKVTRVADNKSMTFNGTLTATNVNGGGVWVLLSGTPVIHQLRGGMTITFDDGTTRDWVVARTRSYVLSVAMELTVTEAGDTLVNGRKIAYWGKNRAGDQFYLSIDKPVVTTVFGGLPCRFYRPSQGVIVISSTITGTTNALTITYGVDASGNPITGALDCPYGYKLNWTDASGTAQQLIVKYW
jgi:uncharacterized lipoprotein YajG